MPAASQERTYKVVLNPQEDYSLWPLDDENPPGWRDAGKNGTKADCLTYIEEVWTKLSPLKGAATGK